jgi:hypothetical protein
LHGVMVVLRGRRGASRGGCWSCGGRKRAGWSIRLRSGLRLRLHSGPGRVEPSH